MKLLQNLFLSVRPSVLIVFIPLVYLFCYTSCSGETRYGPVDYKGTMYVKASSGSDYIGVVFGYQTNRKFYVAMWRKENINFADADVNAGIKGIQLKVRI